ncbi:hypothetical protein [Rhodopirellula sp. MGV]|uniref:hypothetical protein n=1 Tax=Rhodopirellula sp. MGV TaxID=2023130 RepID=UPI000B95E6B6|nr:hypothetical protein [Rhodopirellula sp. MGV]OYP28397.1 hypothetical protein CGZ80_26665 [Rhodopirellula sp. MGV]PNY38728.1 hypothetical protein C2E31_02125 [Rhodopirellula baltica]
MSHNELERLANRRQWLRQLSIAALGYGSVSLTGADWPRLIPRRHVTSPTPIGCLPKNDYQHQGRSPSLVINSLTFQAIESDAYEAMIRDAANGDAVEPAETTRKRFRPNRSELTIDHCRISDVVLEITSGGDWSMSLLAEQNFAELDVGDELNPFAHLRRNRFHFEARLLASETAAQADAIESDQVDRAANPGRLFAARLAPKPFWVQRNEPRRLRWHDNDFQVLKAFPFTEAVEFEFFYQLDPLTSASQNVRRLEDT